MARKEYDEKDGGRERLNASQKGGKKMAGCFGRELGMGIPSYDEEAVKASLTPMKNKFSWMETSQSEAMREVKGRGTSFNEEMKDQRETRREERDRREV